jgi:hypothetical protein
MEARLLMAADLTPPMLEQPAGEVMIPDGDLFLPGSISGRVFAASAADGVYQLGDEGIAGVRVELLASDGRLLAEAFTDDEGRYDFPALAPGRYAVRETQPADYDDGPDWPGLEGAWNEANDLLSNIIVMPGADLTGYDFAEHLPVSLPGEETPPTEPGAEPIPNPTPMPIDEVVASPLAGFVPLPTVEWRRASVGVQEEVIFETNDVAALVSAPLPQRQAERLFGSGGRLIDNSAIDFDAALEEGYDVLAAFTAEFGDVALIASDAATPEAPTRKYAEVAAQSRDAAREEAFAEDDQAPIAEAPTQAPQLVTPPARRYDSSHQLAGKPAA